MSKRKNTAGGYDFFILIPTIVLLGMGLVAIYSSSSFLAAHRYQDSNFFLAKQGSFVLIGFFLLFIIKNIPVEKYKCLVYPLLFICFILLVMVFIPGIGKKVGGAQRWIKLGPLVLQPSELVKLSLAFYMAYSMSKKADYMSSFTKGLLPHLMVAGAFMSLILIQPDLGTTVIIGSWMIILMFVAGMNIFHLISIVIVSAPAVYYLITHELYRINRLMAYLKPWEDPQGFGFQIIHSFLAFGSGGLLGVGLGNSKQKLLYLPESHTDFILSILAEELGLVGIAFIIMLFLILIIRGLKIALDAPDLYSSYLALGVTILMGLQVIINMGVVMGLLPTKGLTLPFLSYGGSSLLVNMAGVGILMSISARK
ncbi:MAG: putative lipid II flippase FtsW [Desulfatiglans sp.]|jgi:cell division protein FtsW|nr:putative lipid II flippase FtsW [Desulfatiglans sp.]